MAKYHTLAVYEGGRWSPEFGDYDRETVEYEREALEPQYRRRDTKIITTSDAQSDIEAAVAKLNANDPSQWSQA